MKNCPKWNSDELREFAVRLYEVFRSTASKTEALDSVSRIAAERCGEYFGPDILEHPDEMSAGFVELLDQIVFETRENSKPDSRIHDYVIDDLHLRLGVYLDIYKDREIYRKNLSNRLLTQEDTIVIRNLRMDEYVPMLVAEFDEQPALQKSILKALLVFDTAPLLNFYYEIASRDVCFEAEIYSLLGLKLSPQKFLKWRLLKTGEDSRDRLIEFVESLDPLLPETSSLPGDISTIFFMISLIELRLLSDPAYMADESRVEWVLSVLTRIGSMAADSSTTASIFPAVTNILLAVDAAALKVVLQEAASMEGFIRLLDTMPRICFDRISFKMDLLGDEFFLELQRSLSLGRIRLHESESNITGYLYWRTQPVL